jgi:hypothetical protein
MIKAYWVVLLMAGAVAAAALFIYGKRKMKDSLPETVDFNIHIRPLLSDRCFNCHGPDANKRQARLAPGQRG